MDFITLVSLFFAGVIMFIAPCTLPLVPGYLATISGLSIDELKNKNSKNKRALLINGGAFVLGFSLIFILFGLLIGLVGSQFLGAREIIIRISGLIVILFGLNMLGVFEKYKLFSIFNLQKRLKMPEGLERGKPTSSLLIGAAFGTGWTPCVGPALGAAIGLASNSGTAWQGAIQLAVFSAGLAVPFLLIAATADWSLNKLQNVMKVAKVINIIGAVFFILLGYILLTNQVHLMSEYSFKILDALGLELLIERL